MTTTEKTFRGSAADAMLRAALLPSLAVCGVCIALFGRGAGAAGAWGAAFGSGLVIAFCGLTLIALGLGRRLDPAIVLLLALGLYLGKVIALGAALVVVDRAGLLGDPFDRTAVGVTVIAATLTWTVAEIVASVRHREPLYDLAARP